MIEIADVQDHVGRSAHEVDLVLAEGFGAQGCAGMVDLLPLIARRAAADADIGFML
jgi:hypothetical protein